MLCVAQSNQSVPRPEWLVNVLRSGGEWGGFVHPEVGATGFGRFSSFVLAISTLWQTA
jgi:hypothetical protein